MKKYLRLLPKRGFTLIELLVVMGIIALLTAVVMFSVSEVRAQSRDKARMVDLKQVELALELYREANGSYPDAGCSATVYATPGNVGGTWTSCDEYIEGLAPIYIPKLPLDPKNEDTANRGFSYRSNGLEYKLLISQTVETLKNSSYSDDFARCDASCSSSGACQLTAMAFTDSYAIYVDNNPGSGGGPECW